MTFDILKRVTLKVFKIINDKDILLPTDYLKIFTEILNAEKISNDKITKIFESEHEKFLKTMETKISELKKNTDKAIIAIENNDTALLCSLKEDMKIFENNICDLYNELFTDLLTNTRNRRWLLKYKVDENEKMKHNGVLIFIDLNDFKAINDNYGHIIGDSVLMYFSAFLKDQFKTLDMDIIRYAGDEFIIIVQNKNLIFLKEMLNKIKADLDKKIFTSKRNKDVSVKLNFSFGMVEFTKEDNYENVICKADKEMYSQKKDKI